MIMENGKYLKADKIIGQVNTACCFDRVVG
jgi:hypothetical protein